jgi:dTDP-4-dehydrorhamnose reductase
VGSPTWTKDLAEALNQMVLQKEKIMGYEVYHYSNEGLASWYDLAYSAIHPKANAPVKVLPILSSQYPTPAERPIYSVLSNEKIKNTFNLTIPNWRESLSNCLEEVI